jgi:hypothetical protein
VSAFSHDPSGYRGGINLYEYVADDPLIATDPYGQKLVLAGWGDGKYLLGLLNQLCPEGKFDYDFLSGEVHPTNPNFCTGEEREVPAVHTPGFWYRPDYYTVPPGCDSAKHKTSCQCICDAIKGTKTITIHNDPSFGPGGKTSNPKVDGGIDVTIGIPQPKGYLGSGDSFPPAGNGTVRGPAFILLGHELCGHAVPGYAGQEAVCVENKIRKEHSCPGNVYGPRNGNDHFDPDKWYKLFD